MQSFCHILKEEFGRDNDKTMKVVELKKVEQGSETMEEFMQEFRRVAKESEYERRLLIEKFKQGMNRVIQQKLIEAKRPLRSIEQ